MAASIALRKGKRDDPRPARTAHDAVVLVRPMRAAAQHAHSGKQQIERAAGQGPPRCADA